MEWNLTLNAKIIPPQYHWFGSMIRFLESTQSPSRFHEWRQLMSITKEFADQSHTQKLIRRVTTWYKSTLITLLHFVFNQRY